MITVNFAGEGFQGHAKLFGFGGRAFFHLHKERVGIGLGDEANGCAVAAGKCAASHDGKGQR